MLPIDRGLPAGGCHLIQPPGKSPKNAMSPLDRLKRLSRRSGHVVRRLANIMDPPPVNPFLNFAAPGHYYNPIPESADIEAHRSTYFDLDRDNIPGVSLDVTTQLAIVADLAQFAPDYMPAADRPSAEVAGARFFLVNGFFESLDAFVLYAMLRRLAPRQMFEVGSGFSSALTLDVSARFLVAPPAMTFVDPEPQRLMDLLDTGDTQRATIIAHPVQQLDPERFRQLGRDDILFIDSSHISKIGSDVNYLLLEALPRLASGVVVHIHDIFWPFEYPEAWFREGRCFNELYLVRALLSAGTRYEILHFNSYLFHRHCTDLAAYPSWATTSGGGSLWLRVR